MLNNVFRRCVVAGIILFPLYANAAIFTFIHKEGGRRNSDGIVTYDRVDVSRGMLVTRIACRDAGVNSCPEEVVGPGRPSDDHTEVEQAAVSYAKAQIALGVLSGNTLITVPNNNKTKRLKWSSSSEYQESGYIKVWESDAPEPF
jgi:hypothetical protein